MRWISSLYKLDPTMVTAEELENLLEYYNDQFSMYEEELTPAQCRKIMRRLEELSGLLKGER